MVAAKKTAAKPATKANRPAAKPAAGAKQRVAKGKIAEREYLNRVNECRLLLERHYTRGEIKKAIGEKYGVSYRTVEDYLSRAREAIVLEISETRDYFRSQSLAVYRSILKSKDATAKEKILAQRQIDHLLGLHAPWKVAQTDTHGKDIPPDEARDRISALASRIAERIGNAGANGLAAGGGAKPVATGPGRGKRKAAE